MVNKPFYYSDVMGVEMSVFGFRILFGVKKDPKAPFNPEDVECIIAMSPQHLKSTLNVLKQNLEVYEKLFGEINLEPKQKALEEMKGIVEVGRPGE